MRLWDAVGTRGWVGLLGDGKEEEGFVGLVAADLLGDDAGVSAHGEEEEGVGEEEEEEREEEREGVVGRVESGEVEGGEGVEEDEGEGEAEERGSGWVRGRVPEGEGAGQGDGALGTDLGVGDEDELLHRK